MIYIIIAANILFMIFGLLLFALVVVYLITLLQLLNQLEKEHKELWTSLEKPHFIFFLSGGPIFGIISHINFLKWFFKRMHKETNDKTLALIKRGKLCFYSFIALFLTLSCLMAGLVLFLIRHGETI